MKRKSQIRTIILLFSQIPGKINLTMKKISSRAIIPTNFKSTQKKKGCTVVPLLFFSHLEEETHREIKQFLCIDRPLTYKWDRKVKKIVNYFLNHLFNKPLIPQTNICTQRDKTIAAFLNIQLLCLVPQKTYKDVLFTKRYQTSEIL